MKYLFDTDSSLYLMAGVPSLVTRVGECDEGSVGISAISLAEIVLGSERGKPPPPEILNAFLEAIQLLPFDETAARAYAKLPFRRACLDLLIGAHALSQQLTLVTNNMADFADIPGLKMENWNQ